MGPLLQPVQVPLDGFPYFQRMNSTAQLGVICKLAEGALNAIVYVTELPQQNSEAAVVHTKEMLSFSYTFSSSKI